MLIVISIISLVVALYNIFVVCMLRTYIDQINTEHQGDKLYLKDAKEKADKNGLSINVLKDMLQTTMTSMVYECNVCKGHKGWSEIDWDNVPDSRMIVCKECRWQLSEDGGEDG